MTTHPREQHHSDTYFVQNRQNEDELMRLAGQDRLVTASMGGYWPSKSIRAHFGACLMLPAGLVAG